MKSYVLFAYALHSPVNVIRDLLPKCFKQEKQSDKLIKRRYKKINDHCACEKQWKCLKTGITLMQSMQLLCKLVLLCKPRNTYCKSHTLSDGNTG